MKLFDSHNHIHMGPRGLAPLLESIPPSILNTDTTVEPSFSNRLNSSATFAGAAIMSTQPKDFPEVESVVMELRRRQFQAVPCFGVHPWFLNEVLIDSESTPKIAATGATENAREVEWFRQLKHSLNSHPDAIVGEIGLDGARWVQLDDDENDSIEPDDVSSNGLDKDEKSGNFQSEKYIKQQKEKYQKRILACPMDLQKEAFQLQLQLAAELQRPVSIHVVRAWGELFESLEVVRERMKQKYNAQEMESTQDNKKNKSPKKPLLPPKIYFHSFSGKAGVLPSIYAACAKGNLDPTTDLFFGFAPVIPNFYAPKTPSILKTIGVHQLVLETDLEDATGTWEDLLRGVEGLATALDLDVGEVAECTHRNAERLYFE